MRKTMIALGFLLASNFALTSAQASDNPFHISASASDSQIAMGKKDEKKKDGSCGGMKGKKKDGSCGGNKKKGGGSCGGMKGKKKDGSCGGKK